MKMNPRPLPVLVARLRKRAKLTVPELAKKLNRAETLVYAWEAAEGFQRNPTPPDLIALCDLAGAGVRLRAEVLASLAAARRPSPSASPEVDAPRAD